MAEPRWFALADLVVYGIGKKKMRTGFRWLFWASIGGIFVGSLLPTQHVESVFVVQDWLVHFAAYAFTAGLATIGFTSRPNRYRSYVGLFTLGAIIEIIQPYVGRDFGWYDMAANFLGVASTAFCGGAFDRPNANS